jgi:hypothetical protein
VIPDYRPEVNDALPDPLPAARREETQPTMNSAPRASDAEQVIQHLTEFLHPEVVFEFLPLAPGRGQHPATARPHGACT